MASVQDTMNQVTGYAKGAAELGLALVLTFVVIDILFPNTTGVLNHLAAIIGSFAKEGVAGLVALLLFLVLAKR